MPNGKRRYKESMKTYAFFTQTCSGDSDTAEREAAEWRGAAAISNIVDNAPSECHEFLEKLESPKSWNPKIFSNTEFKARMLRQAQMILELAKGDEEIELTFFKIIAEKFGKDFLAELSESDTAIEDLEEFLYGPPSSTIPPDSPCGSSKPAGYRTYADQNPAPPHRSQRQTYASRLAALKAKAAPKKTTKMVPASEAVMTMEKILLSMNSDEAKKGLEIVDQLKTFVEEKHTLEEFRLIKETNAATIVLPNSLRNFFENMERFYVRAWADDEPGRARLERIERNDYHFDEIPSTCSPQGTCFCCQGAYHLTTEARKKLVEKYKK